MSNKKHKNTKRCPIYFSGKDLVFNRLPKNVDIVRFILFKRTQEFGSLPEIYKLTVETVEKIWQQWCLPIINSKSIYNKVKSLFEKYKNVLKSVQSLFFSSIRTHFKQECERTLFDLCTCRCADINQCKCSYAAKVPKNLVSFLVDQRGGQKLNGLEMQSSGGRKYIRQPKNETKTEKKVRIEPKQPKQQRQQQQQKRQPIEQTELRAPPIANKFQLNNVALVADRYKVSDRVVATLFNAGLKDLGIASPENAIDRSKVKYARNRVRKSVSKTHMDELKEFIIEQKCCALFFDGKKDFTKKIIQNEETKRFHPRTVGETHYTVVVEPNANFYTHLTPTGPKAQDVVDGLVRVLQTDEIDMHNFEFIGCDGTNFNVGNNTGVFFKPFFRLCDHILLIFNDF